MPIKIGDSSSYQFNKLYDSYVDKLKKQYQRYGTPLKYYKIDKTNTILHTDEVYGDTTTEQTVLLNPVEVRCRFDEFDMQLNDVMFGFETETTMSIYIMKPIMDELNMTPEIADVFQIRDYAYEIKRVTHFNYILWPDTFLEYKCAIEIKDYVTKN